MLNKIDIFEADGTDKFFNALKDEVSPWCAEAKVFTQDLWKKTHSYLDSDLANELRTQFHQRFWEMYLVASLLEAEKEIEKGRSVGPDICIKFADSPKIWVEAIAPLHGTGDDAVQEAPPRVVRSVPDEQIKLRLLHAFDEKFKKFKKYQEKNLVCDTEPCIVAINAAQVPSARLDNDDVPRIVSSLLPFGSPVITVSRETLEVIDSSYAYQGHVVKTSGTQIPTTSFLNSKYADISAVIYSNVDVLNIPDNLGNGMLLFHNPLARNPLPLGFLQCGVEYWVDDEELKNQNWNIC